MEKGKERGEYKLFVVLLLNLSLAEKRLKASMFVLLSV